jgi:phosphosulfolactate synthase
MTDRAFTCLRVPERPQKPRERGWTIPSDPGLGLIYQEDWLDARSAVIDRIKYVDHTGLASYYRTDWLQKKMEIYKRFDIGTFTGGLSYELASLQGAQTEFFKTLKKVGFTGVEISDDVIEPLTPQKRADAIREAKDIGLEVFTEVGRKHPTEPLVPQKTIDAIKRDLESGATKVVLENSDAMLLKETNPQQLIDIVKAVGFENVVFEPQSTKPHIEKPEMLVWLIKTLGHDINVMSISFEDVYHVNQIRSGLAREMESEFLAVRRGKV